MPTPNLIFPKVVQAYMQGKSLRMAQERQQQEEAFRQQKLQEDIRQFDEQAKAHQQEFEETNKIRKSNLTLAQAEARRSIARDASQGIIPGTPVTDNPDEIEVNDPDLGVVRAPSPEALARRQSIFKNQATADKVKELEATLPVQEKFRINAEKRAQERAVEIQEMRAKSAKEVAEMRVSNQLSLEALRNRYRVSNILLRKSLKDSTSGEVDPDVELAANDALKGVYSVEDFTKLGFKGPQRTQILSRVQKAGGRILNETDTNNLKNLTALNSYFTQILEMYDKLDGKGLLDVAGNPELAKEVYQRSKELDTGLGNLATALGGQKGAISKMDVEQQRGNLPSINPFQIGGNSRRKQNLINFYNAKFKAILGNMPKAQQEAIISEYGLMRFDEKPKKINLNDPNFEVESEK